MEANEALRALAREYCAHVGLAAPVEGHNVKIDGETASRIAAIYEAMPCNDEQIETSEAYARLADEVQAQYIWLLEAGYTFEYTLGDPYANSAEMCADVRDNKRLRVYVGGEPHPLLSRTNFLFRAVHDMFGHACEGYQFGPRGEQNAWLHHSMMFSPLAQRALTTETRGQNSWVNYGPHSSLPVCERPFAEQKVGLLPTWASEWKGEVA